MPGRVYLSIASTEVCYLAAACVASLLGANEDLRTRRIPNVLTGSSLVFGLVLHGLLGGPRGLAMAALAGLTAGILLLVMYLAGGMGAGDVKLMAAVGSLAGFSSLRLILTGTFLSGAVFGIALALYHRRLRHTVGNALLLFGHSRQKQLEPDDSQALMAEEIEREKAHIPGLSIPYAVPIAAGCLMAMVALIWRG